MTGASAPVLLMKTTGFLLEKPCGGCTECCRGPLPVPELGISRGKPCRHLCDTGCGDYDSRIDVCRVFSCVWKVNFVADDLRPDKSRVICKWTGDTDQHIMLVPVDDTVPERSITEWKSFARKAKVRLTLYDRETDSERDLVRQ